MGLTVGFLKLRYSVVCTVVSFVLSHVYILNGMYWGMIHQFVRGLLCEPNIYVS